MKTNPFILTLSLNKEALDFFTKLRNEHFPPERNFLKAHLTLFHHLPMGQTGLIQDLAEICFNRTPIPLLVAEPISIGNGVAYKIVSEELQQLHKLLQQQWHSFLIPQDKQKLRPHITIQNKVKPETAKQLLEQLKEPFDPFTITGTGLTLWKYLDGPWEFYKEFDFRL